MAPVKTGYGDKFGNITDRHIQFYKRRARYLGAITTEPLYLDSSLRELPTQIGIDSEDKIVGLKKLTNVIHKFDTKVIAHLNHPGRMVNPKIPGNKFLSSTDNACEMGGAKPRAMNKIDIDEVINLFVKSAIIAEKSGFDIIELQFGHGYLVAQFISPKVNDRTDEYGGNFENRTRLPLQIIDAVKSACKLPIIARISGDEMIEEGIKIDEMQKFAKLIEAKSIDAIHVSSGTICNTPPWYFQHMFVPKGKTWELATKIKASVNLQIIYVGQINEFEDVDTIFNKFKGDFVALGRPLVADPDFVGKYFGKTDGNLRPCMACSEGCLGGVKSGVGLGCIINPQVGKENEIFEKAKHTKNIAVVGGGLSGMNAAITLKQRGHNVTLFEKNKLGGQFDLAPLPPHKSSLHKMIDYLSNEVNDNNIKIQKREFTIKDKNEFEELVIATGSEAIIPSIEGLKDFYWAEILKEKNIPKYKNILIVGGGLIGTEIANKLLSEGNKVVLVEMLDEIARGMEMIEQKLTLKALRNKSVRIFTNTKVKKINKKTIYLESERGKSKIENIDLIVIATGMKSYQPFTVEDFDIPIHIIGDASKVGKAKDAIESAYNLATAI